MLLLKKNVFHFKNAERLVEFRGNFRLQERLPSIEPLLMQNADEMNFINNASQKCHLSVHSTTRGYGFFFLVKTITKLGLDALERQK